MPKNAAPPFCPKCHKSMHFIVVKTGGRKFRCIDCDKPDPIKLPEGKGQEIVLVSGVSTPRLCVAELAVGVESDSPSPIIERKCLRTTLPRTQGAIIASRTSTEQKWHEQSEQARNEAAKLPPGKERERLLRRARQLETASHINDWLSTPGLKPAT
jgi:hypothetical protein